VLSVGVALMVIMTSVSSVASVPANNITFAIGGLDSSSILTHEANPARWNAWQPQRCPATARWRCSCPSPPGKPTSAATGPMYAASNGIYRGLGQGCASNMLPAAPTRQGAVLLSRRGGCTFYQKALIAHEAGFCGLLVANVRSGVPVHRTYGLVELPDMTAEPEALDSSVMTPAWSISKAAGDAIYSFFLANGTVLVQALDDPQKTALGSFQADEFGVRDHQTS